MKLENPFAVAKYCSLVMFAWQI